MKTEKSRVVLDIISAKAAMAIRRDSGEFKARVRAPGEALPATISFAELGIYAARELAPSGRTGSMDAYALPSRGMEG